MYPYLRPGEPLFQPLLYTSHEWLWKGDSFQSEPQFLAMGMVGLQASGETPGRKGRWEEMGEARERLRKEMWWGHERWWDKDRGAAQRDMDVCPSTPLVLPEPLR